MASQAVVTLPPGFVDRAAAMRELGKSDSTIERLVANGELGSRTVPRPGRRAERVYSSADIERLKEREEQRAQARPPSALAVRQPSESPQWQAVQAILDRIQQQQTRLLDAPAAPAKPQVEIKDKLWLSLDEAVAYSGLARRDLIQMCREGKVVARKSGGWKILRKSLEVFEG